MANKLFICVFFCVFCVSINSAFGQSKKIEFPCTDQAQCDYYVEGSQCSDGVCKCPEGLQLNSEGSKCISLVDGYGSPCEDNVQCSGTLGPGGACIASQCACAPTHHYRKGLCWRSIPLRGSCTADDQCFATFDFVGVSCHNGQCQCREEYYEREMTCRRKRNNEEQCAINEDCCPTAGGHGICNSTRFCECQDNSQKFKLYDLRSEEPKFKKPALKTTTTKENIIKCNPGYFLKGSDCVPEIGTDCNIDSLCQIGLGKIAACIDNRECGCSSSLYTRSNNNKLCSKLVISFNGACKESGECAKYGGNAICDTIDTKKVCTCAEGSHFDGNNQLCRTTRHIGEVCAVTEDCLTLSGNVECSENVCKCQKGTHETSDKDCHPDGLHVDEGCQEDEDCLFANSLCSETKQCKCQDHFFVNKDQVCEKGTGSECSDDEPCSILESVCSNSTSPSTCQCNDDYVSSIDFTTCLPRADANEKCEQTDQCNPNMGDLRECRNGACICQENAQYVLNSCYLIKKLGEKCSARAECIYPGGTPDAYICQNAKCACQYGFLPNGNECLPKAN